MIGPGLQLHILHTPSNLGLKPPGPDKEPGARLLAETLCNYGLVDPTLDPGGKCARPLVDLLVTAFKCPEL